MAATLFASVTPPRLWLANPPNIGAGTKKHSTRVVLPGFQTIASEISLNEDGCLVFASATMSELYSRRCIEGKSIAAELAIIVHQTSENLAFKRPYQIPHLRPFILEERKCLYQSRRRVNGVDVLYASAPSHLYPRDVEENSPFYEEWKKCPWPLEVIPSFEFPEAIVDKRDLNWKWDKLVLAARPSKKLLEHLVLRLDDRDFMLRDKSNFTTLPGVVGNAGVSVGSKELVQSHINAGRWIWVTRQFMNHPWRHLQPLPTADLHDARHVYWNGLNEPMRLRNFEPLTLFCSGTRPCLRQGGSSRWQPRFQWIQESLGIRSMKKALEYITDPSQVGNLSPEVQGYYDWFCTGGNKQLALWVERGLDIRDGPSDKSDNEQFSLQPPSRRRSLRERIFGKTQKAPTQKEKEEVKERSWYRGKWRAVEIIDYDRARRDSASESTSIHRYGCTYSPPDVGPSNYRCPCRDEDLSTDDDSDIEPDDEVISLERVATEDQMWLG